MRAPFLSLIVALAAASGAIASPEGEEATAQTCVQTIRAVKAFHLLNADDLKATGCSGPRAGALLLYDRVHQVVRAADDLPAGAYLGKVHLSPAPAIDRGAPMIMEIVAGPVRISRRVIAVQPALGARFLFVEGEDGAIFRASSSALRIDQESDPQ